MALVVERHTIPMGSWEFAQRAPHPALRNDFEFYVGFEENYHAPLRRLEVPWGGVALIVSFGPHHRMLDPERPERAPRPHRSFVAGVHDRATLVEHDGVSRGLEIHFTPLGARRFLGVPGSELTNQVVELEDVLGRAATRLVEQLAEAPTWAERFDRMDAAILERARAAPLLPPPVEWAWRRLRDSSGGAPIAGLAAELGCSRQHLARCFGAEIGLPPKALARILRFERAVGRLRAGDDLADVAYSCGYYDQSHFNRDFRELASTTPTDYVARVIPDGAGVAG